MMGIVSIIFGCFFINASWEFGFYVGSEPYRLVVDQEGLNGYSFLEHRKDDTFIFTSFPYTSQFYILDRDLQVLHTSKHPQNYRIFKAFTTSQGTILFVSFQDGTLRRYTPSIGWWYTGLVFNWLGSWTIDEHDGVIMAAEYTADTAEYARVIRSVDDGVT